MLRPSPVTHPRWSRRATASLAASALGLAAAPSIADQLSVTVRATAEPPSQADALPTTLIEPADVAETPEPICGVCSIVIKPTSASSEAATIVIPAAEDFVGDVDVIVSLDDGRHATGRIAGVEIAGGSRRTVAVTPGDDWRWEDVRVVWTRSHRTSVVHQKQASVRWDEPVADRARGATLGESGVAVATTDDFAGDLTLVIVSDPDPETGRPARATATLDGIQLAAGDDLAIQVATAWTFDWDDVRAAWIELRPEPGAAAGDPKPEWRYVSIRRY
ncbi:MAG: hypothetical protein K8M05_13460 [Deltaproteobacteria bacterium]|nr:hypothetical protein [Kofleriaceae bacterium]